MKYPIDLQTVLNAAESELTDTAQKFIELYVNGVNQAYQAGLEAGKACNE